MARELCESPGGRPGLPVPNKPTVSVDVKQHLNQQQSYGLGRWRGSPVSKVWSQNIGQCFVCLFVLLKDCPEFCVLVCDIKKNGRGVGDRRETWEGGILKARPLWVDASVAQVYGSYPQQINKIVLYHQKHPASLFPPQRESERWREGGVVFVIRVGLLLFSFSFLSCFLLLFLFSFSSVGLLVLVRWHFKDHYAKRGKVLSLYSNRKLLLREMDLPAPPPRKIATKQTSWKKNKKVYKTSLAMFLRNAMAGGNSWLSFQTTPHPFPPSAVVVCLGIVTFNLQTGAAIFNHGTVIPVIHHKSKRVSCPDKAVTALCSRVIHSVNTVPRSSLLPCLAPYLL